MHGAKAVPCCRAPTTLLLRVIRSSPPSCGPAQDLTFSIRSNQNKGETAHLLRGVNGYFTPGQLTALLGPSGSGKTVRGTAGGG
jgi:hypothetical protein